METVEIVVYMGIAVIVGGLIIAFIAGWDATATYTGLKGLFGENDPSVYEEILGEDFPRVVLESWDACGLGSVEYVKTVYVTDTVRLNKSMIFDQVKAVRLCKSLQSVAFDCGVREDVAFVDAVGPMILTLHCDAEQRVLNITS